MQRYQFQVRLDLEKTKMWSIYDNARKQRKIHPKGHVRLCPGQLTTTHIVSTFGRGQHPYCPEDSLQHVWPVLHWDCPSGHTTFWALNAGVFSNQSMITLSPLKHFPEDTSHFVFSGQQCLPSLQHTAWNKNNKVFFLNNANSLDLVHCRILSQNEFLVYF